MGDLVEQWDALKDALPDDDAAAAGMLFDFGDKLADRIEALEAQVAAADRLAVTIEEGSSMKAISQRVAAYRAAKGE